MRDEINYNFVNMNLLTLGQNIAIVRRRHALTQEDVAFELGISSTAYAKIERGETNLSFLRLLQIADVFKIDICDLLQVQSTHTPLQQDIVDIKKALQNIESLLGGQVKE